jgi:hypothetical protein
MNFADISYMFLSSTEFLENEFSERHNLLKGINEILPIFNTCNRFEQKIGIGVSKIGGVIMNLVKIAAVKAALAKGRKRICVCTFSMWCPIWVNFDIRDLRVLLWNPCEFRENRRTGGRTFLIGVNGIACMCVL